jgi:putative membrane protein
MQLARRIAVIWAIDAVALWLLAQIVPGVELTTWQWAIWAVAAIGLLNALVRPFLLLVTMPFTVLSLGLLSVVLNAGMVLLADLVLPGFVVADIVAALWVAFGIAAINTIVTGLLSINDDESFYRNVVLRIARRVRTTTVADTPGLVVLEIDGLSAPMFSRALAEGYMPELAQWVESGRYRIDQWDCGLPSQTSSSQAGILYGRNDDIPAFRWFEKSTNRLMVSNYPFDAAEIHRRLSDGSGLLSEGGASIANLVSGDASHPALTMSAVYDVARGVRQRSSNYYLFFLNPYSFVRTIVLMLWEIVREIGQRWRARFRDRGQPHTRGGSFPLLRAVTNVFLRDLNLYLVIEHMFSGTPVIYSTLLGYDIVAHYAGPASRDALLTLRQIDDQVVSLKQAAASSVRPYEIVVLSDHGQSPGSTFRQRYGETLEDLVQRLVASRLTVSQLSTADDESWGHLNALLSDAIQRPTIAGRAARRVLRRRTREGYVEVQTRPRATPPEEPEVIVCTSGNLGLIYFTEEHERLTLDAISADYPGVIEGLVQYPGVGFIVVSSTHAGPIVIGREGVRYLDGGRVTGHDPLAAFGSRAAGHLSRVAGFANTGDIIVNSVFDPSTGEVAAFESQVGSHGGLGGEQTQPFLLAPAEWPGRIREGDGPCEMHRLLRDWVDHLSQASAQTSAIERSALPASTD